MTTQFAQELMRRLATPNQQSLLMQPRPLSARTSAKPLALGVVRGTLWHILCSVDDWEVTVAPPPALARFGRRWSWSEQGEQPIDRLATALGELAEAWWSTVPEAVGALDVAGAITHAATAALGEARGPLGTIVYSDPGRGAADRTARVGVARDRRDPRWPYLVDVYAEEKAVLVRTLGRDFEITDVHQLVRELPAILEHLRGCEDACETWQTTMADLYRAATEWSAANPPPVPSSAWSYSPSGEVRPDEVPVIWLLAKAFDAERFSVRMAMSADGPVLHIGNDVFPVVSANAATIAQAIEREAREARDPELSDYERYR